jgi:PAS domain S-box-containing protein
LATPNPETFLVGGGEVGRLMRERDWSTNPLGAPARWPEELRAIVALLLLSKFPMFVAWGEQLSLLYNDAYAEILGDKHPAALGAPFYEVWSQTGESDASPRLSAALAGDATYAENQEARVNRGTPGERAWFTYSYSPARDRDGLIRGVFCAVTETTEQMRERDRQAFRLRLEQRLRDQTEPTEILSLAAEALGEELGVGRVGYGSVDASDEYLLIERDWTDNRIPSAVGRHRLDGFGAQSLATLKAGDILAIDDISSHPYTRDRADSFRQVQIGSLLAVPLIKSGRFTALLFLHDPEPRHWSEADQALVGEVGDRTWAAVERARAQAELRRSETRFRALATTGDSMVYRVSADWRHLLDFDRDDFVPPETRADQEWGVGHVHPDDVAMRQATIARAIRTREMLEIELRVQGKDGNWRWLRSRAVPIFDERGEVVEWFGAATDITDRHEAEDRLRGNEEQLRLATEAAEIGLWDVDTAGGELLWPARVKAMFGISADVPVVIEDFYNSLHEEDRDRVMNAYAAATDPKRRAPYDVEYRAVGKEDGVVRWVAGKGRGIFVDDRCVRIVGTAIDITRRKDAEEALRDLNETLAVRIAEALEERAQAEEALRQAQKMEAVGRLVGGIAHDFNNLLGAVVGSLELIRHRSGDPERVKRYVDVGMQAADRGAKLTGQLLAFSRSQRIELKPIAAAKLIGSIRSLLSSTLGPMVELRLMLEDHDQRVLSDATQLEMGLINLAINARDAMPDGGRATITTRVRSIGEHPELAVGDYLEIRMEDTGCGMTPEVASRALDPFFTTKDIGKGTGLGLSQVYGIAKQAGGTVQIETALGHGTAINILLPCVEGEPTTAAGWYQETSDRMPIPARVLVIDDDKDMLRVISDSLEMLGYSVAEATNGVSGLRVFEEFDPDLVIVDFAMPGMNGAEVARAVRDRRPTMPIIFASGYSDTEAIERVIGAEAKLLRKPFGIEELKAAVMAAL